MASAPRRSWGATPILMMISPLEAHVSTSGTTGSPGWSSAWRRPAFRRAFRTSRSDGAALVAIIGNSNPECRPYRLSAVFGVVPSAPAGLGGDSQRDGDGDEEVLGVADADPQRVSG